MLVAVCTTNPTERYIAAIPDSRNALAGRRNATRKSRLQVPADKSSVEGTQIVSNPHKIPNSGSLPVCSMVLRQGTRTLRV
jgi:hypothetical protein